MQQLAQTGTTKLSFKVPKGESAMQQTFLCCSPHFALGVGFSKQLWPYTAGTEAGGKAKSVRESVLSSFPEPAMVPAPPQRAAALQIPAVLCTNSSAGVGSRNTQDGRDAGHTWNKTVLQLELGKGD